MFRAAEWEALQRDGHFAGSADDLRDGFIHLSTQAQLPGTLAKHFANMDGLVIARVTLPPDDPALRFEPSRGGQLFPHLYRALQREECVPQPEPEAPNPR
ncbi:MAG: DUF952 domain-containing protein [Sphingomonadaceae bacterium]